MICKYRKCDKEVETKKGPGRKRQFCDDNCKGMEQYFKQEDNKKVSVK